MDDEVQAILDKAARSLKKKGYAYWLELRYQKDGLQGRIILVPMPKRHEN